jgi:two-component system, cell cycle sensor histidine kinase and response regulator CckA
MTSIDPVLRILHLEDDDGDSELIQAALVQDGLHTDVRRAQTASEFVEALRSHTPDIVLADFTIPGFDGMAALRMAMEMRPDIPFIFVSGTIGEERAAAAMKLGAADYVLKGHLAGLSRIVQRAIREAGQHRARRATEKALADMQQRMEFALDAAEVGIWEWDMRAGTLVWSALTERLHGFETGAFHGTFDEALACTHADDRQRMRDAAARVHPSDPHFRVEYRVLHPDGSLHWIAGVGQIAHDEHGGSVRASGVCYDITARRSLEDQLRQAQRLESIGGLAAGVAHDFNNLLSIILGYSEILMERHDGVADIVSDLSEISHAANSATALTRQLLAFSRKQILTPKVMDLSAVVRDTQKMMRRLIEENVRLDIHCADAALPIEVDVNQIEQVILNLVVNARDAMPEGGVVTIETDEVAIDERYVRTHHFQADLHPGQYARLTVSDTGSGIPPEIQSRLFEPFFTTKEQGRGTGLGLATVYGIVKQSGGQIFLYSEVGLGTTFKIYFPISDRSSLQSAETAPRVARSLSGRRILVVEDQPSLQMLVSRMLAQVDCHVRVASSAEEAQQILSNREEVIDVVLTDIVMPGDSGYLLAKWVSDTRPGVPVIYMTGYSERAIAHHGVIETGTTLLQKPFSRDVLVGTIQRVLSQ